MCILTFIMLSASTNPMAYSNDIYSTRQLGLVNIYMIINKLPESTIRVYFYTSRLARGTYLMLISKEGTLIYIIMSSFSSIGPKLAEKKGIHLAWDFSYGVFLPVPLSHDDRRIFTIQWQIAQYNNLRFLRFNLNLSQICLIGLSAQHNSRENYMEHMLQ